MSVNLATVFVCQKRERFSCGRVFRKGQAVIPTRAMLAAFAKAPRGEGVGAAGQKSPGGWRAKFVGRGMKAAGIPAVVWVAEGSGAHV